ncbi:TAF9 factor, partial [Chordeiles acutipennis]|nr:TAF9 factor [Chordeiles acutipennis]
MEPAKMASPKSAPKDAQVMAQILKDMGITEYEPRVINQMLEFAYSKRRGRGPCGDRAGAGGSVRIWGLCQGLAPTTVLSLGRETPRGRKGNGAWSRLCLRGSPLRDKPQRVLPGAGAALGFGDAELHVLSQQVSSSAGRITVPRLSVGAVSSRPSTPTLGTPSAQTVSVSAKVGTPVSLTGQRFTVQIPSSQAAVKSATPTTPTVQNVLINPSLIGPKNILITTNMVSAQNPSNEPNALKRKHEDDDDYDNL